MGINRIRHHAPIHRPTSTRDEVHGRYHQVNLTMNNSYTEGPWEFVECGTENALVIIGGITVGGVYRGGETDSLSHADAYLISAAPDLLECLKELLSNSRDRESYVRAGKAIDKAEGVIPPVTR